ncbi:MAG: hypothetical protein Q9160_004854 [Pyrenula sp. 1 TL-2023]
MSITQIQSTTQKAKTATTRRPNTAPLPNAGAFDPDELCRRLELYKQHMRQARRLREVRLEQVLKAEASASKSIARGKRNQGSEAQNHQAIGQAPQPHRKRAPQSEKTSYEGIVAGASAIETDPGHPHASYIPQTAAFDFAKTTTSEYADREKALRRLSASRYSQIRSSTERDRRSSMQDEALRILNGRPAVADTVNTESSKHEIRRPKSSIASFGPSHRPRTAGTMRPIEDADRSEHLDSLALEDGEIDDVDGGRGHEGNAQRDKTKRLHGPYYTLEYRHDWTEKDETQQAEKSPLSKKLSRMLLSVKRSEPRPESRQANEPAPAPAAISRRRSSFLGLFK